MTPFISLGAPALHPPDRDTLNAAQPLGPVSTLSVTLFVNGSYIVMFSVVGGPLKLKLCVVTFVTFAPMSGVSGLAYVKAHALIVIFLFTVDELLVIIVVGEPSLRFPKRILMTVLLTVWLPSTLYVSVGEKLNCPVQLLNAGVVEPVSWREVFVLSTASSSMTSSVKWPPGMNVRGPPKAKDPLCVAFLSAK